MKKQSEVRDAHLIALSETETTEDERGATVETQTRKSEDTTVGETKAKEIPTVEETMTTEENANAAETREVFLLNGDIDTHETENTSLKRLCLKSA